MAQATLAAKPRSDPEPIARGLGTAFAAIDRHRALPPSRLYHGWADLVIKWYDRAQQTSDPDPMRQIAPLLIAEVAGPESKGG